MQEERKIIENYQGLAVFSNEEFTIDRQLREKSGNAHAYHYHDSYELYYLFSGDRYYFIKDKTYHAKRGSLVLIKPYEIHCASKFSEEPYERILISFKESFVSDIIYLFGKVNFFESFEKDIHMIEFSQSDKVFVEALLNTMVAEHIKNADTSECFLKTALAELLIFSLKHSAKHSEEIYRDSTRKTVALVAAYINNNFSEDLSLENVAARFFISPCYLSRTFKRISGSSFTEYVNGVRIKEGAKLLLNTDMTVSSVAISVGFKNTTHFGRAFKSIVGVSPLMYRKM